ncbi:cell wall hydrolase [Celeribacter naphthalenivorans]|uniref:cell wall hydrolase n=1 Tax=Celeribacter naphthalenivorans TaxID=1614694 RepID=UPI001CF960C9|nr:cell wall hydrolase [Celeribacter naphthalenivorans]
MQNFIFGGDTPWTYEELQRKREIADQLAFGKGTPRNVGEGLAAIGDALLYRSLSKKADARDAELRGEFDSAWGDLWSGGSQPYEAGFGEPYAPIEPMEDTRALNDPSRIGDDAMAAIGQPSGDRDLLAKTLMAEAGGEGAQGMLAAGAVIDNRRKTGGYGDGFDGVIMKPGQFSAWNGVTGYANGQGGLDMARMKPSEDAYRVADAILSGQYQDPTGGATHYYNPAAANPAWGQKAGGDWQRIGNHVFGFADAGRGGAPSQPRAAGGTQVAQSGGMDLQSLADLASNPYASPGQKAVLNALIGQQMNAMDPMRQIEMQRAQLELQQMQNPTPKYRQVRGADIGMTGNMADAMFNVGPDGRVTQIGGGGTTINNNMPGNNPGLGKLSTDYGYVMDQDGNPVIDPATGLPQAAAVPGSPAAIEAQQAEQQRGMRDEQAARAANIVIQDIDRAIEQSNQAGTTGFFGGLMDNFGGTNAHDLQNTLRTVQANIGFDRLQQMREASPTGGALGAVSERELTELQAVLGSIQQSQSKEQLQRNLNRLKDVYSGIMEKASAYPNAAQFGFGGAQQDGPSQGATATHRFNPETGKIEAVQ